MKAANFSNAMSYANKAGHYTARYEALVDAIKGFPEPWLPPNFPGMR